MEEWKDIEEYEGLYQVSNLGRVKSLYWNNERIMKTAKDKDGYLLVNLYKNKKGKSYLVHRLVAMAFIPNPNNLPEVNHKDEDKTNNNVDNMEWCGRKYNINYGTGIERRSEKQKTAQRCIPVYQYTLDGKFIAEYLSIHEVERQTGYFNGHISNCCNGKRKTAYGFIWRYKKMRHQ